MGVMTEIWQIWERKRIMAGILSDGASAQVSQELNVSRWRRRRRARVAMDIPTHNRVERRRPVGDGFISD